MPLNVNRFCTSLLLVLVSFFVITEAQVAPTAQAAVSTAKAPTSAEVMRDRISKAKAYIAVRNYSAAIYELENIRRETSETSVQNVTNVLLMNSYLEQGDYKRAKDFLTETFNAQKGNKQNSLAYYSTIAGQIIKGSRNQIERYRALGLTVSDRNLPLEAVNDIERMRETLELVVSQTKEIGKDKKNTDGAMALLEEATNSRSALARDEYDARRWRDEIADSREQLANSRSVITNAVDGTTTAVSVPQNTTASNTKPVLVNSATTETTSLFEPVFMESKPEPSEPLPAEPVVEEPKKSEAEPRQTIVVGSAPKETPVKPNSEPQTDTQKDDSPLEVGSLISYATKQAAPIYPSSARNMRASGVVKVEVTVSETGDVSDVQKTNGHMLLQTAAKDAVRKWKFKPFVRDGQPVKATGFVNFNFSL